MKMNALGSEVVAITGVVDPDANTAGAITTAYADMKHFDQLLAIVQAGVLGASGTLDAKMVQATDSSGTGVKDVTGKAITQLVKASNDDDQAVINLRAEELDIDNGFSFAALVLTTAVATGQSSAVVLGMGASYAPASDFDLASVQEIVN